MPLTYFMLRTETVLDQDYEALNDLAATFPYEMGVPPGREEYATDKMLVEFLEFDQYTSFENGVIFRCSLRELEEYEIKLRAACRRFAYFSVLQPRVGILEATSTGPLSSSWPLMNSKPIALIFLRSSSYETLHLDRRLSAIRDQGLPAHIIAQFDAGAVIACTTEQPVGVIANRCQNALRNADWVIDDHEKITRAIGAKPWVENTLLDVFVDEDNDEYDESDDEDYA